MNLNFERLLVFESRESSALVVAVRSGAVVELERLAAHLLVDADFGHHRNVIRAAECCALVTVTSFRIRHVLLLLPVQRVLAQARVILHKLQALRRVALVLGRRVIVFTVLGAHDADDFACFTLLRHGGETSVPPVARGVFGTAFKLCKQRNQNINPSCATRINCWP